MIKEFGDGILLIANKIPTLKTVKSCLGKFFSIKDMEDATTCLVSISTKMDLGD